MRRAGVRRDALHGKSTAAPRSRKVPKEKRPAKSSRVKEKRKKKEHLVESAPLGIDTLKKSYRHFAFFS